MHFYATFGRGHYNGLLKDYYVEISANDMGIAMKLMREAFENKYSNVYQGLPDEVAIKYYPKGCLGKLKETYEDK